MKIKLSAVEAFIKISLRRKLQRDLRKLKIIKESDLETCTYYHLRRFLKSDSTWNILTRRFVPITGYYVDVVLFKRAIPCLALELKWHKKRLSKKDRKSLNAALKKLKVNKVYYLTTTKNSVEYEKMNKRDDENYRFKELVVGWDVNQKKYQDLMRRRRQYRREMVTGKNKRRMSQTPLIKEKKGTVMT